jgi:hypothetical protein
MLVAAFVVMQFIISAKAGLVNAVEGRPVINFTSRCRLFAGQTGATGKVSSFKSCSFLRLGEGSEAVLESVELTNVVVRIVSVRRSSNPPRSSGRSIHVKSGPKRFRSLSGVYRFSETSAFVWMGSCKSTIRDTLL